MLGVLAGTFFVLQRQIESNAVTGIKSDLQATRRMVADLIEERGMRLNELGKAVVGSELMRTILTDTTLDRLTSDDIVLNEIMPSYPQLSLLSAVDNRGTVRASNPLGPDIISVIKLNERLKSGLNGWTTHGFFRLGRSYHQIIAQPLMIGPPERREMLGAVILGIAWTAKDLAKLRNLSGADLALLADDGIVSSAGEAFGSPAAKGQPDFLPTEKLARIPVAAPEMHTVAGERYLFLRIESRAESGMPTFIVAKSLDAQLDFVNDIRQVMLEFAGIGVVVSVVVSFLMAMGIARPIQTLTAAARNVANDNFGIRVVVRSKDEFAQLGDAFNQMIEGLRERDLIRSTFGRYVDRDVAQRLLERPESLRLGGEKRDVVVFMADIRGFSSLSEQISPEQTVRLLNRYFAHIIRIIQTRGGVVVDFVGDGILVLFDPLESDLDTMASAAVSCAFEMQGRLAQVNAEMAADGLPSIAIGIGLNAGPAIVGNIGSKDRAKFGIVGAEVNLTQRIQGEAKPGEVVLSATIYERIRTTVRVDKKFRCELKGFQQPRTLYAVVPAEGNAAIPT